MDSKQHYIITACFIKWPPGVSHQVGMSGVTFKGCFLVFISTVANMILSFNIV